MPNPVNSILVLIASPGDAAEERATVRDILNDWSVNSGRRRGIVILPWLYERNAVARLGDRAQALINAQAVDQADVVIAFFDSRLGTNTGVDVSGTAEEINRAATLDKPVHVYFSSEPIPRGSDLNQLAELDEFKETLKTQGLLGDYTDPADLAAQIVRALELDIDDNGWSEGLVASSRSSAQLSWRHDFEQKISSPGPDSSVRRSITRSKLVVKNSSGVTAESLKFTVEVVPDPNERMIRCDIPSDPITLYGHSELQWSLITGRSTTLKISAQWLENQIPRTMTTTIITQD